MDAFNAYVKSLHEEETKKKEQLYAALKTWAADDLNTIIKNASYSPTPASVAEIWKK